MKLFLSLVFAGSALAQPFIISSPKFDASSSIVTMPNSIVANTGLIPSTGCFPGRTLYVVSNATSYTTNSTGSCTWTPLNGATPGGTSGQIQWNNGGVLGGLTVGGDGTLVSSTGVLTVTKTGGVAFAASATTDTTNAANITSNTLSAARLPGVVVLNNGVNTGTAAMTLNLAASTVANAFRVPIGAGLTATLNGALGYDTTANMWHLAQNGADAYIATFTGTPTNGSCANFSVSGGIITLGNTGAPCGSGSGAAFSGITTGTNTTANMVVGIGASLSTTGSGTIAATSVSGFTPGVGVLTGPGSALTLTASGGVMSNNTSGTAGNLSGTPALPNGTAATTQTTGDSTTKIATDAFVAAAVASSGVTSFNTRTGAVTLTSSDVNGVGGITNNTSGTSSNLSGTPALPNGTTATTQSVSDNTTKIATDAFVIANAGTGTVVTSGTMTNTAIVTSVGGNTIATPSATATLDSSGDITLPGWVQPKYLVLPQSADPGAGASNTFELIPNPSITSYRWMVPSADAAGLIGSDGNATPGHLSVAPLSGDATTLGHTLTLATVNSGPGTCGDATHVCQVTTNGKGLVTSQTQVAISGGGSGLTSVGLSLPPFIMVSGSPLVANGTITGTLATQAANAVFVGPTSGSAAAPTFRSLVSADVAVAGTLSNSTTGTSAGLNGVNMASLPTGIIANTTGTGVPFSATYSYVTSLFSFCFGPELLGADGNCHTPVNTFNTRNGAVTLIAADVNSVGSITNSTSGTASNVSGTPALPNGTTATTQTTGDNTTKLATDAFVIANAGGSPTGSAGGYLGGSYPSPTVYSDIRNFGVTYSGGVCTSSVHTGIVNLLQAGLTQIYIPSGCTWIVPSSQWSYTKSGAPGGVVLVPANSIPSLLTVTGQDINTSVIQTTSPSSTNLAVGAETTVDTINMMSNSCSVQPYGGQPYIPGVGCPNKYLSNMSRHYVGVVNTSSSGNTVTWVSGTPFFPTTGSDPSSWVSNSFLMLNINGVSYTVASVVSTTSLTLTTSPGNQSGVGYMADQYHFGLSNGNAFMTIIGAGGGDANAIHLDGYSTGDTIYASALGPGVAFRGYGNKPGTSIFLAEKDGIGNGYMVSDDSNSTSGYHFLSYMTNMTTGVGFGMVHGNTAFSGDSVNLNMAAGSGSFTGNFIRGLNNGTNEFYIDNSGNIQSRSLIGSGNRAVCVNASGVIYAAASVVCP